MPVCTQRYDVYCAECPDDFTYNKTVNSCYKVVLTNKNWEAAGQECQSLGAHLVVIGDAAEQSALATLLESKGPCSLIPPRTLEEVYISIRKESNV